MPHAAARAAGRVLAGRTPAHAYHPAMTDKPAHGPAPRRPEGELASAAARVAEIVAVAERAAEELRAEAERRANERIAEADRAAAMRVQAADDEAMELRTEAAQYAQAARDKAAAQARELLAEARGVAREVLRDGEEITTNLSDLGDALRANAERLLRDIRLAHAELTARLDDADPSRWEGAGAAPSLVAAPEPAERSPALDVPEFIPRPASRRRR
jgi:hypothetical protein